MIFVLRAGVFMGYSQQRRAKALTIWYWFLQEASQVARGMSTTELRLNKNLLQKVK